MTGISIGPLTLETVYDKKGRGYNAYSFDVTFPNGVTARMAVDAALADRKHVAGTWTSPEECALHFARRA